MFKYNNYEHLINACNKLIRESTCEFSKETQKEILDIATFAYDTFQSLNIGEKVSTRIRSSTDVVTYHIKNASFEQELLYHLPRIKQSIEEYNSLDFSMDNLDKIDLWYQNAILINIPKFTTKAARVLKQIKNINCGLFKLYDKNNVLVYIGGGRTNEAMKTNVLRTIRKLAMTAQFISYAETKSAVDTNIYMSYYIGLLKPTLNTNFAESDLPTIRVEELSFSEPVSLINR